MTQKTILHISKYYYPEEGGIETVARYLAEGMREYRNIVICFARRGKTRMDTINGICVYRIAPLCRISHQDICFSYGRILRKICREYHPDLTLIHCPNPFVYPIMLHTIPQKSKIALLWHADILNKGILYKLVRPLEQYTLRKADLILTTSPNYIDPSSPIYYYRNKIRVLQNGVIASNLDLRKGDREAIGEIRRKYDSKPLILFVGRHIPYKGIDCLIKSAKYLRHDAKILIAGRGPETEHLKLLSEGNDHIVFLGRIDNNQLRQYYYASQIFGFSSITKQEAFGVALAEAMYCGCVPVTFKIQGSGVNWVNKKGVTGEEVPLKDVHAYAQAIDRILDDSQLYQRYKEASMLRIRKHFTDKMAVDTARTILGELLRRVR